MQCSTSLEASATVVLPVMSRQIKANSPAANATLDWGLRSVLLIAVPATLALILLAEPILITLFRYGQTSLHDVQMSAYSLVSYSLGLPAFMLIKVLVSGFYSRQDTRTPVKIGLWTLGANMLLIIMLIWLTEAPNNAGAIRFSTLRTAGSLKLTLGLGPKPSRYTKGN